MDSAAEATRPTFLDQLAEAKAAFWGEWSVTVHGGPFWLCGCVSSSTLPWGLTSSTDSLRQQGPWIPHLRFEIMTKWSSRATSLLGDVGSKQWTPVDISGLPRCWFSAVQRHTRRQAEGT